MGLLFFRKDSFLFPAWLTCHLAGMTSHAGAVFVTTPAAHGQTSAEQQQGVEEDSSTQEQPPLAPSSLREEDSSTQEQPPLAPSSLRTTLKKDLKNLLTCCSRRWRQPSSTPLLRDEDQQGEPVGTSTTDTTAKAPARTQNSGNVEAEQRGEEASMTNAEDRVEGQGEQQAPAGEEEAPQAPQAEPEVADQVESDLEYADEEEPGVADHSDDQVVQEAERFVTRLNAPENAARRPLVDRFFKSRTASPASWEYFQLGARGNKLSRVLHARLDHDRVREYAEDLVKHRFPRVLPDLEQLRRQFLDDQQSVRARNAIARQNRITALEWRRSRAFERGPRESFAGDEYAFEEEKNPDEWEMTPNEIITIAENNQPQLTWHLMFFVEDAEWKEIFLTVLQTEITIAQASDDVGPRMRLSLMGQIFVLVEILLEHANEHTAIESGAF